MKRALILFAILTCGAFQTIIAQESGASSPVIESRGGYLLGPGDQVTVKVLGESQFDFIAEVNEEGKIEIPYFDQPLYAMCKSDRELRAETVKVLSKYLRSPQVTLNVTERKSRPPVIINGQVRQPMQVTMYRRARLLELISMAGGVTEDSGGMIQVFRTQAPICGDPEEVNEWKAQSENSGGAVSSLYSYSNLRTGTNEANPIIYPGDFIVVQKAAPVYFTGEIRSAQGVYIPEGGLSLFQAISMLGGVNPEAKTKDIKIYRLKANSKDRDTVAVNFDKIKKGEQKDVMLEPYDIVEVDKAKKGALKLIFETATGIGRTALTGAGNILPARVLY